jgi:receptor protein-tyrosine kinase
MAGMMDQAIQDGLAEPQARGPRTLTDLARAGLIIESQGRTRLGDEFRIAASRLQSVIKASVASGEKGGNLLLITSTRPAEGKSFSSINLAAALTQTSSRHVLLVDADSKPRCLSELLGIHRAPGLLDLAADFSIPPESLVVPTALPKLSVLPLGNAMAVSDGMPSSSDDRSQPLAAAAELLSRSFPQITIVLDTGPLLSTSDPSVLAPSVAQIVMVVEAGKTQRAELDAALDLIRSSPRIMLMLNKVAGRNTASFGAYSYSGDYYAQPNLPPPQL